MQIQSRDPLFIGTLRPGTEVGAQEGKWNFQGRDDVMVPMRKLKPAESEEFCTAPSPAQCHHSGKEEEVQGTRGLRPGGKWYTREMEERIVNPRGRVKQSHLLEGAYR